MFTFRGKWLTIDVGQRSEEFTINSFVPAMFLSSFPMSASKIYRRSCKDRLIGLTRKTFPVTLGKMNVRRKFAVGETETRKIELSDDILDELRSICSRLPETYEESAWVGTRWMIRHNNFAHALVIDNGWPPAYARAVGSGGPMFVLTFRTRGEQFEPPEFSDYPFFRPGWFPNIIGMILDDDVD